VDEISRAGVKQQLLSDDVSYEKYLHLQDCEKGKNLLDIRIFTFEDENKYKIVTLDSQYFLLSNFEKELSSRYGFSLN